MQQSRIGSQRPDGPSSQAQPGSSPDDGESVREVERQRWNDTESATDLDHVVREEPLELRVAGLPLAVLMRTPGHDEELARGFMITEGIVPSATAIARIATCSTVDREEAEDNILQITLADGVNVDIQRFRRNLYATSSCGVCGKATIERAMATADPIDDATTISVSTLYELPDRLNEAQTLFRRTGGLHAAGLFDRDGRPLVVREDIGRHNAVDKVVGWAAIQDQTLSPTVLMVSGRVSFEIIQKALAARIPIVAAVSAASSLAAELARTANVTLVAFLRGRSLRVYANDQRIVRDSR